MLSFCDMVCLTVMRLKSTKRMSSKDGDRIIDVRPDGIILDDVVLPRALREVLLNRSSLTFTAPNWLTGRPD